MLENQLLHMNNNFSSSFLNSRYSCINTVIELHYEWTQPLFLTSLGLNTLFSLAAHNRLLLVFLSSYNHDRNMYLDNFENM